MLIDREKCVTEVQDRVTKYLTDPKTIPFPGFELMHSELTPVDPVGIELMPCVLFLEGEDEISRRTSRTHAGYPVSRIFSLLIEVWAIERSTVVSMYKTIRKAIFENGAGKLPDGAIREEKAIGPFTAMPEGAIGIRTIYEITYEDKQL